MAIGKTNMGSSPFLSGTIFSAAGLNSPITLTGLNFLPRKIIFCNAIKADMTLSAYKMLWVFADFETQERGSFVSISSTVCRSYRYAVPEDCVCCTIERNETANTVTFSPKGSYGWIGHTAMLYDYYAWG